MATETAAKSPEPKVKKRKKRVEESSRRLGADEAEARAAGAGLRTHGHQSTIGLVLPASTKYLVDNVISKRQIQLLTPIVLAVLAATVLQGLTSFTLTQVLSKSAQKMIAELRRQVQAHIGRFPSRSTMPTKPARLVSRIMSDVEGVRNLIGTGLVEFVRRMMTAVIALGLLDSYQRDHDRRRVCHPAGLRVWD